MVKPTTVLDKVHTTTVISRIFHFHPHTVAVNVRSLSSLEDCLSFMRRCASVGSWLMVGRIYGELHAGSLPVKLDELGEPVCPLDGGTT